MKLSRNKKLFLKINSFIGKNKIIDQIMFFCAQYLIYILVFGVLWLGVITLSGDNFKNMIKLIMTAITFYIITGWSLALIWKHRRPIVELVEIKELLKPIQVWKSFPSDHTGISFIFALIAILFGCGLFWGIIFIIMASLIAFSRIYVGVHYPRDIIGRNFLCYFFVFISFKLLENVTQPLYNFFINLL